jgi:hypothetical protein
MKKLLVFLSVMAMGCTMLSTAPSVYAEGVDEHTRLMFHSDKLGNFFVSYTENNLTNVATKTIGIWQLIQIDYGAIRYRFFRNAKSGYIQLWNVSSAGIFRLYGGKLLPAQQYYLK